MRESQHMENEYQDMLREFNKNGITAIDTYPVW
jgi:hypothetical protein